MVDVGGRSRSSASPDAWGYARPREESIQVNIGYMTRLYRRRADHVGGKNAVIMAACRPDWHIGVALAQKDERWIVTLGDDQPQSDEADYVKFAHSLQRPEVFKIVRDSEPLSEPTEYQFAANLRMHYEDLKDFPAGYLVFGDALRSFIRSTARG